MIKQQYEDYKYVMTDTAFLYIGSKYSYREIWENEDIPFKFRTIVERYLIPEIGAETTLESDLYHMTEKDFTCRTYLQLRAKVKVSQLVTKKGFLGLGKPKRVYQTVMIPLAQFVKLTKEEKEKDGIFIQELSINKLALMAFAV
ncbi:MAG: hypothetical protein J6L65_00720 [Lachnospiraceae bacterium]|nr:hypothetical protein [Lachnospiraceae bacterium]